MSSWNGKERRAPHYERRQQERRRSMRYATETLIVLDGVTWVDNQGTDRRLKVRRREDRELIARRVLNDLAS